MAHYSAFCINPKPQGLKRWSKSDPRLQDDRLYPKEVYGLSSHLAEKQKSKDAHPMEGKESWEELNIDWFKCHCRPHPSVWKRRGQDL